MESASAIFDLMGEAIRAQGPELVEKVKGIILYDVGGKQWTADLKNGAGAIVVGKSATPDVTITLSEEDFVALATGKLNPQQAFMRGKLKLKGNMAIAMKLNTVLDAARKAGKSPAPSTASASASAKAAPAAKLETPSATTAAPLKSQPLFDAIALAVRADGATFVKKVNGVIQFNVTLGSATAPAATYLLDLKNGAGSVSTNPKAGGPSPDITITIADDDFVALADGKLNPQAAFMKGKLKVKGNMALAMKLQTVIEAARKTPAAKL